MADVNRGNRPLSPHLTDLPAAAQLDDVDLPPPHRARPGARRACSSSGGSSPRRPARSYFAFVDGLLTSWIGGLVLIVSLAALWYHFFNGIRHLVWDTGAGFELDAVAQSGIAVLVAAGGDDRDHADRRRSEGGGA